MRWHAIRCDASVLLYLGILALIHRWTHDAEGEGETERERERSVRIHSCTHSTSSHATHHMHMAARIDTAVHNRTYTSPHTTQVQNTCTRMRCAHMNTHTLHTCMARTSHSNINGCGVAVCSCAMHCCSCQFVNSCRCVYAVVCCHRLCRITAHAQ